MEVAKVPPSTGPVDSAQAALDRTYLSALAKDRWLSSRYHFGEAVPRGNVFEVFWYVVEAGGLGRGIGVHGAIDRTTGVVRLQSGFFRLPSSAP